MEFSFNRKQYDVYNSFSAQKVFLVGAVRSGKTWLSYHMFNKKLLELIVNNLPGDVAIIGVTERTVLRNVINPMKEMFGDENVRFLKGSGEAYIFDKLIYVIGANDKQAESKIRGMTVALALVDEATMIPEGAMRQLFTRLSLDYSMVILTTNPDSPFHYLKTDYIDKHRDNEALPIEDRLDLEYHHFTLDDNAHLSRKYKNEVKKEFVGFWYRRFILGEWCLAQGLVYDSFDPQINVYPNNNFSVPIITETWLSCDYGPGNVTVYLLNGIDKDGNHYIMKEWYYGLTGMNLQKSDTELVKYLNEFLQGNLLLIGDFSPSTYEILCDPTATSFIVELRNSGFKNVRFANNDVLPGIRNVHTGFANRRLFIHESCKETIKEISTYSWDDKKQKEGVDKPVKNNDHCMDALRYGYYTKLVPRKRGDKMVMPKVLMGRY